MIQNVIQGIIWRVCFGHTYARWKHNSKTWVPGRYIDYIVIRAGEDVWKVLGYSPRD